MALRQGYPIGKTLGVRAKRQIKPPGTRCYVPGFLSDDDQFNIDQSQLGVAPVVATGLSLLSKGRFKTPAHKRAAKEAPRLYQRAISGDNAALVELERLSRHAATAKAKAIFRQWYDKAVAALGQKQTTSPAVTPPVTAQPPTGTTQPPLPPYVPGITIQLPSAPPSAPPVMATPPSQLPGGEAPVPDDVAQPKPKLADMFGGEGLGKLILPGLGLLLLSQFFKKGR